MIIRSISCTIFRPLTTNRIGKSLRWVTVGTDEGTDDNFSSDAENRKLNDKGTTSASSENQTHRTEPTTYSNYTNDTIRWWLGHGIFLQYRPSSVLLRVLSPGNLLSSSVAPKLYVDGADGGTTVGLVVNQYS
jgi:hypothetical protein